MHVIAMESFTETQWADCYAFYERIYQECYPHRELPSRRSFLQNPGPYTTVATGLHGFALCTGAEWLACCHYKVNAEQSVLTSEVKFKKASFDPLSASAMVHALRDIARTHKLEVLQMVAETTTVRDFFIDSGDFQKVGCVRESVLDLNYLDHVQQKQWRKVAHTFQLKLMDWDDPLTADAAVALYNQGIEDVPIEDVVGSPVREDRRYFINLRTQLRTRNRELVTFGLYDGADLAGLALFECGREEPKTFMIHYTGIARSHRRQQLGKALKAWTVDQLRLTFPSMRYLVTGNHQTNGPILRINDAMGFRVRAEFTMLRYQHNIE